MSIIHCNSFSIVDTLGTGRRPTSGSRLFSTPGSGNVFEKDIHLFDDGEGHTFGFGFFEDTVWTIGAAFKLGSGSTWTARGIELCGFHRDVDGTGVYTALVTGTDGGLEVWSYFDNDMGTATLLDSVGTPGGAVTDWYYLELQVKFSTTAGEVHVWRDETEVITVTGVDTGMRGPVVSGEDTYSYIFASPRFYDDASSPCTIRVTDLYVGLFETLGDVAVVLVTPISSVIPTRTQEWGRPTGMPDDQLWTLLDEIPPDTTTYIYSGFNAPGAEVAGYFVFTNVGYGPTIAPGYRLVIYASNPGADYGTLGLGAFSPLGDPNYAGWLLNAGDPFTFFYRQQVDTFNSLPDFSYFGLNQQAWRLDVSDRPGPIYPTIYVSAFYVEIILLQLPPRAHRKWAQVLDPQAPGR